MTDGTKILIHHLRSFIAIVRFCCLTNRFHSIRRVIIVMQYVPRISVARYVLNSVTYQLCEMVVLGILSGGIGNLTCKRNVLSDMARNVYPSFHIGIIILPSLVLSVQTLLHCTFQECRKQVDEEIENAFYDFDISVLTEGAFFFTIK